MKRLCVCMLSSFLIAASAKGETFWEADVWKEPDRPFLFYGEGKSPEEEEERQMPPRDPNLESVRSIEGLKRIVKKRLERAVIDPSEANVKAYLEANYFLIQKAGRFAEAWRDTLLAYPAYDWTSRRPTVNAASTKLSRDAEDEAESLIRSEHENWGVILYGDAGKLTQLMRPIAVRFAALYGLERIDVAVGGPSPYLPGARIDRGHAAKTTPQGLSLFPAVVLVHKGDASLRDARLIATGVVDVAELTRRTARMIQKENQGVAP